MEKATKRRGNAAVPAAAGGSLSEGIRENQLLPLVEAEIIPRLMMAHRGRQGSDAGLDLHPLPPDEVVVFVEAILRQEPLVAGEQVTRLRANGLALESVYLYLLAPAARYLGELWEADLCSFSQVTLGLWRIQQIMYDLSPAFHASRKLAKADSKQHRILIATLPGSQHTFGLSMLSEFFRGEGWTVLAIPAPDREELLHSLNTSWFDIFALSVSADRDIDALQPIIAEARKLSCNPGLGVMVGGALFMRQPALAETVGADGMSDDAPGALLLAGQLLKRQHAVKFN